MLEITIELSRFLLVEHLKYMFLVFKQYYTYFYTLFHLQIFQKNTNNISQIPLSNGLLVVRIRKYIYLSLFGAILCVCVFFVFTLLW